MNRVFQQITLPVKVAKLVAEPPDELLLMPVADVSVVRIRDTWQAPRGEGRKHEGQDIFAPRGTPVVSAVKGFVYRIRHDRLGGKTVSVLGRGRRVYYYAHLSRYAPDLEEWAPVEPGTVLGFVGTTGNARTTPPHLHFGIYGVSGPIDPLPMLVDPEMARIGKRAIITRRIGTKAS